MKKILIAVVTITALASCNKIKSSTQSFTAKVERDSYFGNYADTIITTGKYINLDSKITPGTYQSGDNEFTEILTHDTWDDSTVFVNMNCRVLEVTISK